MLAGEQSAAAPRCLWAGTQIGISSGNRGIPKGFVCVSPPSAHIHMEPEAMALAHVCDGAQRVEGAQHRGAACGAH